jgi:hypothetical protein
MAKIGDFFTMTRRERVGTLVVLFLLIVALVTVFLVRSSERASVPRNAPQAMEQFMQQTDTANVKEVKKPKKHKRKKSTKHVERSLEPVPQF